MIRSNLPKITLFMIGTDLVVSQRDGEMRYVETQKCGHGNITYRKKKVYIRQTHKKEKKKKVTFRNTDIS